MRFATGLAGYLRLFGERRAGEFKMNDCIFCRIAAGKIPSSQVFQTEDTLAFLDIAPIAEGHTLLIPKQHCSRLEECPVQVLERLAFVLPRVAAAVQKAMGADGYNVLCNNGRSAGQVVEHLHFHIIPRKMGDGIFHRWPSFQYPEGKADLLAAKIRQELQK